MRKKHRLAAFIAATAASITTAWTAPCVAIAQPEPSAKISATFDSFAAEHPSLIDDVVSSMQDEDSAAHSGVVDIPRDPRRGITLYNVDQAMTVNLPDANLLGTGVRLSNGSVIYESTQNYAVIVAPNVNGAQILTVIYDEEAPTDYDYPVALPDGGSIEVASDGKTATIFDDAHRPAATVSTVWAKASNGDDVATSFSSDGKTLSQHVAHTESGTVYPVFADPSVSWQWYNFTLWYYTLIRL